MDDKMSNPTTTGDSALVAKNEREIDTICELQQQLTAEREKVSDLNRELTSSLKVRTSLRKQIAASVNKSKRVREQMQPLVDSLTLCVNTLRDKRIGTVDYMEGFRIYDDFKIAADKGADALANFKKHGT